MWFEQMHLTWQQALPDQKPILDELETQLAGLVDLAPKPHLVMKAFEVDPSFIKVVIIGQDPYPTAGVAIGQAFAVRAGNRFPGSLRNIDAELKADVAGSITDSELKSWTSQGVLLLNTSLTTVVGHPGQHSTLGWQKFTTAALTFLAARQPLVILAWGKPAQKLANQFAGNNTRVIEAAHPSPLSAHRGFLGSKPFSRANLELRKLGITEIDW